MFSRLRSAFTYANTVSTIALFLVLAGGAAYAAIKIPNNSVGTKQIKNGAVTKGKISASAQAALKGNAGPRGLQGIQGIQGIQGVAGNPAAYPTVLPSGRTETGAFAVRFLAAGTDSTGDAEVSFPLPLSSAPTGIFCGASDTCGSIGTSNTDCPGTLAAPTATAGDFCVYLGQATNVDGLSSANQSGTSGEMGSIGGALTISSTAAGDTILRGTWAYTAP